jgi:4a-hydroxytetrahydrobiopterin dehydratase
MTLLQKHCKNCAPGTPALGKDEAEGLLVQTPGWDMDPSRKAVAKTFSFDSYWAGLGFVNAVAWIAQSEKHHPDVELLYKKVKVRFSTHAVDGLSENDFICAAKVNALVGMDGEAKIAA